MPKTDVSKTEFDDLKSELEKLKKDFELHNHTDKNRPVQGGKNHIFQALKIKLGDSQVNAPVIQIAKILATPTTLADGDIWFDGANILIRINGATYTLNKTAV